MKTASIAPSSAGQRRKIIQQFFGVFYCFCLLFLLPRKFLGFLNPFCSLPVLHRTESHVHFDRVELRVEIARNREADKKRVQHAELGAYLAPRMMMAGRDNRMGEKLFFIMLYFFYYYYAASLCCRRRRRVPSTLPLSGTLEIYGDGEISPMFYFIL